MIDYKTIPGFEKYVIHRDGYVINTKSGRKLKPDIISKGYEAVTLSNKMAQRREYIHRLLAQAFIHNEFNKPHVNHINGIRLDNRIENLEWCTPKENIQHAYRAGLVPTEIKVKQAAKLNPLQVLEIRKRNKNGESRIKLAAVYGVTPMTIGYIVNRTTWRHI